LCFLSFTHSFLQEEQRVRRKREIVRKSKRSERERDREFERMNLGERDADGEGDCRNPANPEEPIVDGSPPVNPSEAIFGEAEGDFRWVFG
jgi:hypothetical protein